MSDNTLLRRHAERWAQEKHRPFDGDLLETVVDLRMHYDERPATSWPAGSVTSLLLERWPAHGPLELPDLQTLQDTLDTFWRFLRATGRMASGSAPPADLLREARRALPMMADACSDRTKFSSGRVLQEFGRTIGVRLDEASDMDELTDRLARVQAAWNDLPMAERQRLMPDPTPKTARGLELSEALSAALRDGDLLDAAFPDGASEQEWDEQEWDDDMPVRRGDPSVAAAQVRDSAYVRACLALADWVGDGRAVTATGVLRPAVGQQAYDDLGLAEWDREFNREAARPVGAAEKRHRSAGECLALDRLWFACDEAGLLDIRARQARSAPDRPQTDGEWLLLGLHLLLGLLQRFEPSQTEPLLGILLPPLVADDGRIGVEEVQAWWRSRSRQAQADAAGELTVEGMLREFRDAWVEWVLAMFGDTGIWVRSGDELTITDFGREFAIALASIADEGFLQPS